MKVLSGPIMRRTQTDFFSVQIVIDALIEPELSIFLGKEEVRHDQNCSVIRLSNKIFFYIIRSSVTLDETSEYSYDIINKQISIFNDPSQPLASSFYGTFKFCLKSTEIATGSCRKLSCDSDDMLAQMSRNYQDTKPSALLLTGDQIYADDIGSSVLKRVRKVCEHLNLDVFESSISRSDFSTSIGLTSAKSKNHLLSFGELLAIYLLSWSEKLWHESSKVQDMYDVRCFLAQVPVYMIMDDHDVSDDLKINQAWEHQLKPDGYRYLADAYALGWIFQGMGNLREACEYDELIKQYIENETSRNALSQRVVKEADWSFSFTDNDRSILFLDTRNHRYGGKDFKSPAGLISPEALHCQFSKLSESKDIILVSASPVYGFECVEKLQDDLSFLPDSVTLIDRESWHAPSAHSAEGMCLKVLEDKLNDLSCERLLIISGDTHYSYVRELSLYNKKAIQIVSSALKNKPPLNMLANFVFSKFNQFSKSEKYLNSDQDEKILYHSNYCSLDLKGEMKIQMYSRDQEHKFYPWKS